MFDSIPVRAASFSGHESFPLRFLWLKKGYDQIRKDAGFFGNDDAMVVLGTGKNMVRSIRHWGLACGVWEEVENSRGRQLQPTEFGDLLLADGGWDPFLEELGTIWLLHWKLVTHLERATTWTWVFGRPKSNRFTRDEITDELVAFGKERGLKRITRTSLRRDVDVLIRSYTRAKMVKGLFQEDSLDSPFVMLELIRPAVERGQYEIVEGPHPTLPIGIFEYALAEYYAVFRRNRQVEAFDQTGQAAERDSGSVSLDELLYAPCSPGRTFRLNESALLERIKVLIKQDPDSYVFDDTAGIRQLLLPAGLIQPIEILEHHYFAGADEEVA
jgi:hypothetical protein